MDAGSVTTARTVMRPAHPVQRVTSTSKVRRKSVAQSTRESGAAQSLACEIIVGGDMDAGVQVEALVHGGVGDARGWLGKLVLGALAGVLRHLEGPPLHPREGHGLARAVQRRLVRGVDAIDAPRRGSVDVGLFANPEGDGSKSRPRRPLGGPITAHAPQTPTRWVSMTRAWGEQ